MDAPTTLQRARSIYFSDLKRCNEFMASIRWTDGKVRCPNCGATNVTYMESVNRFKCYGKHPKAQFSLKVGTIFEDSPLGLDKWLMAVWLIVNAKNGISSYKLRSALSAMTQKSAWLMIHRIRLALQAGSFGKLSGEVEVDETYIGGKARNMSASRKRKMGFKGKSTGFTGKVAVMGLFERNSKGQSRVKTMVVPNNKRSALQPIVRENVIAGSTVNTDALMSYYGLDADYIHNVIDHAEAYVDGTVHTNSWKISGRC